ncbi:5292_t:CDS:1, partial [Ambispora leptoticha]
MSSNFDMNNKIQQNWNRFENNINNNNNNDDCTNSNNVYPIENDSNDNIYNNECPSETSFKLNQQLGPEYISHRPGPGNAKIAYLEGFKAIQLANEIFGYNRWSSSIGSVDIDFVDENNGRYSIGLSVIVRVTLIDGAYHEDIGYGDSENQKSKSMAFQHAKKEAVTDGLKRALRQFGNVLGNCLYDKNYLKSIGSIKAPNIPKINPDDLYRASYCTDITKNTPMNLRSAAAVPAAPQQRPNNTTTQLPSPQS